MHPNLLHLQEVVAARCLSILSFSTEPTAVYIPSQNGIAERLNRTLITRTRALLIAAELPDRL
jgi:hypothetical protein